MSIGTGKKMNKEEFDIDKRYEEEKERLKNELEAWERCYERFKSKFDKIAEYERRVERLEAELEDRDRILKLRFKEEKNKLLVLMVFFAIVSVIFVRITSQSENVWAFFIAGLLVGIGWAIIFKMLMKSHNSLL